MVRRVLKRLSIENAISSRAFVRLDPRPPIVIASHDSNASRVAEPEARVSVRSGHSTSKSAAMAAAIWWKLVCSDYSKVASTRRRRPHSSAISSGRNLRSASGPLRRHPRHSGTQKAFANELVASRPRMLPKSPSFMFIVYYLPELRMLSI